MVMKWTVRREDGTTLDRDTITQEVVKPLARSANAGEWGHNTSSIQGNASDAGADARSSSTLARNVLEKIGLKNQN